MTTVTHSFNRKDRLGRDIGCVITHGTLGDSSHDLQQDNWADINEGRRLGKLHWAYRRATRAGNVYGAAQHRKYYATEAERAADDAKYLKAGQRAADKREGK